MTSSTVRRVLVVDDHAVVRAGIELALSEVGDLTLVGEAATADEALALVTKLRPDLVLLDVRLGDADGPVVCQRLLAKHPQLTVVMFSAFRDRTLVLRSLASGAAGYLLKDTELTQVVEALRRAADGQCVLDPRVAGFVVQTLTARNGPSAASRRLSPRDLSLLTLLAQGKTTKEIASELAMSPYTVDDHIAGLARHFGVRGRLALVATVVGEGVVESPPSTSSEPSSP